MCVILEESKRDEGVSTEKESRRMRVSGVGALGGDSHNPGTETDDETMGVTINKTKKSNRHHTRGITPK